MKNALKVLILVVAVMLIVAAPAMAAPPDEAGAGATHTSYSYLLSGVSAGAGIGAGIGLLGAGYGFSRIGSAALESMARQPEMAGRIQTAMIVIAALLEGATFFGLLICLLVSFKAGV
jgi:F-type H+-transporting ATPase subunit c